MLHEPWEVSVRVSRQSPRPTATRANAIAAGALAVGILLLTRRMTATWGTYNGEHEAVLPGDDLVPDAVVSTRAVTIAAPPTKVWPWIAQLGQGRGGFYSYDMLENLVGLNIHSANQIEERWQDVRVGDPINLAAEFPLEVALVQPGHHLVLAGAPGPLVEMPAGAVGFTWAFVVLRLPDGRTRLLVRERYARRPVSVRIMAEAVQPISFVMSQKMLRGIRARAEALRRR